MSPPARAFGRLSAISVIGCLVAPLTGCGDSGVAAVTGTVTYNGRPVPNAAVLFVPRGEGKTSVGATGDDGAFTLRISGGEAQAGATVGVHDVSVSAYEAAKQPKVDAAEVEEFGSMVQIKTGPARQKSLVPPRYGSTRTSGLSFEVKAGAANVATFELVD